jgi:hypothetical protein
MDDIREPSAAGAEVVFSGDKFIGLKYVSRDSEDMF